MVVVVVVFILVVFTCQCVSRYEREEPFYSLQVTVKNHKLEDSLEQFVNGEILEGDNAYFCEKCNERVNDEELETFVELSNL